MYSAADTTKIKALYENLVVTNLIRIDELDGFGDPIAHLTPEAERQLVSVITECKGFPWRCVIENAGMTIADTLDKFAHGFPLETVMGYLETRLKAEAIGEIKESIFSAAELNFMHKNHPDYLDLYQDNLRRGKIFEDEMSDLKREQFDIGSAEQFNKVFREVA